MRGAIAPLKFKATAKELNSCNGKSLQFSKIKISPYFLQLSPPLAG